MLENNDRRRIEDYVRQLIDGLRKDSKKYFTAGMTNQQLLDKITTITVNKLTPESKMILSSTYNMLKKQTMKKTVYANPEAQAAFYQADILGKLNKKFVFEVPSKIDYEESQKELSKWIKCGAVVITGGVISIPMKSFVPVGIAVVIAAIMAFVLNDKKNCGSVDIANAIDCYFSEVEKSMLSWIHSIEKFYDESISQIEEGMDA